MKYLIILLFFISCKAFCQDTTSLNKCISNFNDGLIEKDSLLLNSMLDDNITYGHSNGWIQTKKDLIADFYSGKIEYKHINPVSQSISINNEIAIVRSITKVEGIVNTIAFNMTLQILQVWNFVNGKWILIARQSVKV